MTVSIVPRIRRRWPMPNLAYLYWLRFRLWLIRVRLAIERAPVLACCAVLRGILRVSNWISPPK